MNCPKCNVTLAMTDRQGVEIDFCPQCRGVWLDRGELDKIIERSNFPVAPASQPSVAPSQIPPPRDYRRSDDDDDDYRRRGEDGHYGRKKKGFLGDLFDF